MYRKARTVFLVLSILSILLSLGSRVFAAEVTLDDVLSDVQAAVPVSTPAPEPQETPLPVAEDSAPTEDGTTVSVDTGPLPVVVMDADAISAYSVGGSGYTGSISTSVLEYFEGVLSGATWQHYVVFKADQYNYYCFWGSGFSVSNNQLSGSGDYIRYNSYDQRFYRGTDSFVLYDAGYYVYTNAGDGYARLTGVEGVRYDFVQTVSVLVLVGLWIIDHILFRRRSY